MTLYLRRCLVNKNLHPTVFIFFSFLSLSLANIPCTDFVLYLVRIYFCVLIASLYILWSVGALLLGLAISIHEPVNREPFHRLNVSCGVIVIKRLC